LFLIFFRKALNDAATATERPAKSLEEAYTDAIIHDALDTDADEDDQEVTLNRYVSIETLLTLTTEHRGRWHRPQYK
jgi:hypothetical protein